MINITDSEKQGRDGAQSLDKFVECERRATSSSTCAARADNNLMRTMARRGRQEDVEYGSTATCSCAASDLNRPAVLGHNSTADPQSKSSSSLSLGGEERLEDPLAILGGDARPRVGDNYARTLSFVATPLP
jgi:hypothetical protein